MHGNGRKRPLTGFPKVGMLAKRRSVKRYKLLRKEIRGLLQNMSFEKKGGIIYSEDLHSKVSVVGSCEKHRKSNANCSIAQRAWGFQGCNTAKCGKDARKSHIAPACKRQSEWPEALLNMSTVRVHGPRKP